MTLINFFNVIEFRYYPNIYMLERDAKPCSQPT
jgi:hypothetical protein